MGRHTETEDLARRISSFLAARLGADAVGVEGLHRLGEGSSRENWSFDACWIEASGVERQERLILRRDPSSGLLDTARSTEFALLRALENTPVSAPRVWALDKNGEAFGRPSMVVQRHAGRAHRAVLRDRDPLGLGGDAQVSLANTLATTLAAVHGVEPSVTGIDRILPSPGLNPAETELAAWTARLDHAQLEPQPALEFGRRWLQAHLAPPPGHLVLVHGDYRPANVLVDDGRLSVLLDWELARLGDPHDDLGWYLADVYGHEHLIPGSWEHRDFLATYAEAAGFEVDRESLAFWRGMAAFRLAVMALTGARAFCLEDADRPFAPTANFVRRLATDVVKAAFDTTGADT